MIARVHDHLCGCRRLFAGMAPRLLCAVPTAVCLSPWSHSVTRHQLAQQFFPGLGAALLLAGGLALLDGPAVDARALGVPQAQPPAQATQAPPAAGYVGDDTCTTCHTDQTLKGTKHGMASNPRTPAAQHGCESCHGPGQAHVDDDAKGHILKFAQVTPRVSQPDVPDVPQPRQSRRLGGQRARTPQSVVHHLPQRAQSEVGGTAARQAHRDAALRDVPSASGDQDRARRRAHAGARGQDVVHAPATTRTARSATSRISRSAAPSPSCARAATRRCAGRCCSSTRPCARTAPRATTRTARRTIACWSSACRCSASAATSRRKHPATLYDKDQITTNKSNRMFGRSCVNCHSNVHGSNHPSGQFFMR